MTFELALGIFIAVIMAGSAVYLKRKWRRWKKDTEAMFETTARYYDGR